MDAGSADLGKAQRRVKGIRGGIGRVVIDLADDAVVSAAPRLAEQIFIEPAGVAAAARGRGDDNAVDIDEAAIARAEPQEVALS